MNRKKFIQTAAVVAPILYSAKIAAQEQLPLQKQVASMEH